MTSLDLAESGIRSDNLARMAEAQPPFSELSADFLRVLDSASRLQELVPDAVLVGGAAAVLRAGHRESFDHDHVVADLAGRFDAVLEAVESQGEWVTNRVTPGKLVLGQLGDIEAGVRQLIRTTPLEVEDVVLPSGRRLRVPTADETLRVKSFLLVRRNQTRDYLDVVALADRYGLGHAAGVLRGIDRYYADQTRDGQPVASQVVRQLGNPSPKDSRTTRRLADYRSLDPRWHRWRDVVSVCHRLAELIVDGDG